LKAVYFASDVHLGFPDTLQNHERERIFVNWLNQVKQDASMIFLLGDVFDFWFEYKKVPPRGLVRVLGKLAEICDSGIPVHFFTGNHDIWVFDYLPSETGMIIHHGPFETEINGKKFFMAHGDDMRGKDAGYQLIKKFFNNSLAQWAFAKIHPDLSFRLASHWSKNSRLGRGKKLEFLGENKEDQIIFAKELLKEKDIDYFVFGHRHLALEFKLSPQSNLYMLGDWFSDITYGVFDGINFSLKKYQFENK
jgi:UDP-2,3-diacylglucosamine hydrolase